MSFIERLRFDLHFLKTALLSLLPPSLASQDGSCSHGSFLHGLFLPPRSLASPSSCVTGRLSAFVSVHTAAANNDVHLTCTFSTWDKQWQVFACTVPLA